MQERAQDVKTRVAGLFDRLAPTYDTVIPFFGTFARRLVEIADLTSGARVLDVACGRGACSRAAAAAVGPRGCVIGLDISEAMVDATAKELAGHGLRQVEVRVGDAEHIDAPDESFDAVVCGFGVFFFPDPDRALAECHRVLVPGGRLAASTFTDAVSCYPWVTDVAAELGRPPTLPDSPVRKAEGLRAALERAGFAGVSTTRVEERFVLRDVDEFVAFTWSTGIRRMLETLDADELRRYREASAARLAGHAVEGGYEYVQAVDITVALRP
ncbi:MAG TPA: methyltransferase domain-containing protein [Acidimicrobiia bacterium]|nr:methyltransferase domain-containing protein [Acidimicrobiia bacterium]